MSPFPPHLAAEYVELSSRLARRAPGYHFARNALMYSGAFALGKLCLNAAGLQFSHPLDDLVICLIFGSAWAYYLLRRAQGSNMTD